LDYVLIVTPNFVHFDPAMKALKAGHTGVLREAADGDARAESAELVKTVRSLKIPFGVAHTYLGHWTSRLSRYIVQSGLIGDVRWVDSYYLQGWLATKVEATGVQQAVWRTNPKMAGGSGCGGDIGTHALMQLRYVTGLDVTDLSAQLETFVEGRALDDHFTIYCKLSNGGKALVRATQIAIGHKNDLGIEINGTKGTLVWRQEDPECLTVHLSNQPDRVYWRGAVTPGDGFLPKDVPADLMAEPTVPPVIRRRSTMPSRGCIAVSKPTSANGKPANRSPATGRSTRMSRTVGWASRSSKPASRAAEEGWLDRNAEVGLTFSRIE
jgi:predicted dehydrogenase